MAEVTATVCEIGDKWVYVYSHSNCIPLKTGLLGCIDCSYSMDSRAKLPESDGEISFIALTRSILASVVDSMPEGMELRIGSFADTAREDFSTLSLDDGARAFAKQQIDALTTRGSTNLYAAVKLGYDNIQSGRRVVVVLTDGSPTIRPAEGEENAVTALDDGRTTLIIIAVANSSLDLKLMHKMAVSTGGYLVYVHDASMGATCVINAAATIATLADTNLEVRVDSNAPINVVAPPCYIKNDGTVNLGLLMRQSHRDLVVTIDKVAGTLPPNVRFIDNRGNSIVATHVTGAAKQYNVGEYARSSATVHLAFAADNHNKPRLLEEVRARIVACANDLVKMSAVQASPVVDALLEGLDGELTKAIHPDNIGRWGGGALYAALSAHWNRICLNFRDPDMQMYQTEASADIRTKAASSFVQPSFTTVAAVGAATPARSMANYYDQGGGCIFPGAAISTIKGRVAIECILPGTRLKSGDVVREVVKTPMNRMVAGVELAPNVMLTPFHPVCVDGRWTWPRLVHATTLRFCDAVYNLVLEDGNRVDLDGVTAITLGHELEGPIVEHHIYGSRTAVYKMIDTARVDSNHRRVLAA